MSIPPRVSIIVPNYNHARFLPRRIDSILEQTFQDFELILLDDRSPDNSLEVLNRYTNNPRVRLIENQANSGSTFKQWNKGVREARGEYVWLAESDDFAHPRLLATLVDRLDNNQRCAIAYCQSYIINDCDEVIGSYAGQRFFRDDPWTHDFVSNGARELFDHFLFENMIPNASAAVFRRATYNEAGGADERLRLCGDWKLWSIMLTLGDLAFVAEPLNYFRTHTNNVRTAMTSKGRAGQFEAINVLHDLRARVVIPRAVLDRVYDRHVIWWLRSFLTNSSTREQHRKWFEHFRAYDGQPVRRIFNGLMRRAATVLRRGGLRDWTLQLLPRLAMQYAGRLRSRRAS